MTDPTNLARIEFSSDATVVIDGLIGFEGAKTRAQVVANGLRLLVWYRDNVVRKGHVLGTIDPITESVTEVTFNF